MSASLARVTIKEFRDDDAGYRAWIYSNPSGFVVS
jgi:hypothetical protein